MTDNKRLFTVNGKPFYPLGRHRIYMGGYSVRDEAEIEANFKTAKLTNGNTVCLAIFWDQLEPEEGKFNFSSIDTLISIARRYELKLIFLWFATWKNGVMDYAPAWMKADSKRFKRVTASNGKSIWVLSSHCQANLDADKQAFKALCQHLKDTDRGEQTVIGLQVENEPGILGSDRDYSPEGQAVFDSPVPAELISAMIYTIYGTKPAVKPPEHGRSCLEMKRPR
jgi:beta-galactosidase GanA